MTASKKKLPFYPTYKTEVRGHVTVWWFFKQFSQSHYNYKNIPCSSNACTIITILLAAYYHYEQTKITSEFKYELSEDVVYYFAKSILDGNQIYDKLRKIGALANINLTVPEAMQGIGRDINVVEWKSELYTTDLENSLYNNIKKNLSQWISTEIYKEHPDLYIILITDQRSVLIVYQDSIDLISLIDSHQHLDHGALIAQVRRKRLKALCFWFSCMIVEYFNSHPDCYELSFLYFTKGKLKKYK